MKKFTISFYDEADESFESFDLNISSKDLSDLQTKIKNDQEVNDKLLAIIKNKKKESKISYIDADIDYIGNDMECVRLTIDPKRDRQVSENLILDSFLNDIWEEANDLASQL